MNEYKGIKRVEISSEINPGGISKISVVNKPRRMPLLDLIVIALGGMAPIIGCPEVEANSTPAIAVFVGLWYAMWTALVLGFLFWRA